MNEFEIRHGDALTILRQMPSESVNCCVTSPPYFGLRDYGNAAQIGLESTPEEFIAKLVEVFAEVRRVLKNDATLWVNIGDSYAGSWGAQSRGNVNGEASSTLEGSSMLSARQIFAHPKTTHTGSLKNTPGCKPKDLIGIPWMLAFALRAAGWYLRQEIIWAKPNPMPESVTDRCTKSHEQIFLLSKQPRYYFDQDAIREPHTLVERLKGRAPNFAPHQWIPNGNSFGNHNRSGGDGVGFHENGRNKRSVWAISTQGFSEAHFATFPPKLIEPCILAGCPEGGTVLDPFAGAGTTGLVALRHGRKFIGIELNPTYAEMATNRILDDSPLFNVETPLQETAR